MSSGNPNRFLFAPALAIICGLISIIPVWWLYSPATAGLLETIAAHEGLPEGTISMHLLNHAGMNLMFYTSTLFLVLITCGGLLVSAVLMYRGKLMMGGISTLVFAAMNTVMLTFYTPCIVYNYYLFIGLAFLLGPIFGYISGILAIYKARTYASSA